MPVPPALLAALDLVRGIREIQARCGKGYGERLWPWSRMSGWRAVHGVMATARLDGPHAASKGLRHGFGVAAVAAGVPLNLVQKWLGHAQLSTTAIYADAVGRPNAERRRRWCPSAQSIAMAPTQAHPRRRIPRHAAGFVQGRSYSVTKTAPAGSRVTSIARFTRSDDDCRCSRAASNSLTWSAPRPEGTRNTTPGWTAMRR